MALLTLAEYQAITGDTAHDTRAGALLAPIEAEVLRIRGAAFDVDSTTGETVYNAADKTAAALMIAHLIARGPLAGATSDSFAGASATFDLAGPGGWPKMITGRIVRFVGAR